MDGLGTFGKLILAAFVGGVVFVWVGVAGLFATAPEGTDPFENVTEVAVDLGLLAQPPIELAGVTWEVVELSWTMVGDSFRARAAVVPDRALGGAGSMTPLCRHVVANKLGAPVGPARAADPYRVDIVLPDPLPGTRETVFPFTVANGNCEPFGVTSGLPLAPPLKGWRSSSAFEIQLTSSQIAFGYPAWKGRGPVFRRHVNIGPRTNEPLQGELAGEPGTAHMKLACEMLISETDFGIFAEEDWLSPMTQTISNELVIGIGNSRNKLEGDPVVFRVSGETCREKS